MTDPTEAIRKVLVSYLDPDLTPGAEAHAAQAEGGLVEVPREPSAEIQTGGSAGLGAAVAFSNDANMLAPHAPVHIKQSFVRTIWQAMLEEAAK